LVAPLILGSQKYYKDEKATMKNKAKTLTTQTTRIQNFFQQEANI